MKIIPESILQASVKVANEAPQDLKANLRRAYAHFDQEFLNKCQKKPLEFKACLFALCHFHSLVLGRKKFGAQGWSINYNFNDGDLRICANVLYDYFLKYIFGEIIYGGYITDDLDRKISAVYLRDLIKPELLQYGFNLGPGFKSPNYSKNQYEQYMEYIEKKLPIESPQMFGLHPNAEISDLTQQCDTLFITIRICMVVKVTILMLLKNSMQKKFCIANWSPNQIVCTQECQRMDILLDEIIKTISNAKLNGCLYSIIIIKQSTCLLDEICLFLKKVFGCLDQRSNLKIQIFKLMGKKECHPSFIVYQSKTTFGCYRIINQHDNFQRMPQLRVVLIFMVCTWKGLHGNQVVQKLNDLHPKLPVVNVIAVTEEKREYWVILMHSLCKINERTIICIDCKSQYEKLKYRHIQMDSQWYLSINE
ncbi:unnamed protein product (macronuclear) [Paramecium tetraurelia]|uniref:Dynein heavy chain AAA lid domain-containing protein n=1 Tax=Paramecium tetraurelia TaxID=5888 RepID=A0DRV5_PARTE|nr:uncharacterized protein GSPATT00039730001 [Paramecium tetraurelia]CAK85772.1 unnamed protein product [Paramecium tetraurelia]|eukprot:XP_001453169.1 hypothetical protein (macronuclear) [Paramecium tetraurelia strain d4-2]